MSSSRHTTYVGVPTGDGEPPFAEVTHIVAQATAFKSLTQGSLTLLDFSAVSDTLGEFTHTPTDSYFSPIESGWYRLYGSLGFSGITTTNNGIYFILINDIDTSSTLADFSENPDTVGLVVTSDFYYSFYLAAGVRISLFAIYFATAGNAVFVGDAFSKWYIDRMDG